MPSVTSPPSPTRPMHELSASPRSLHIPQGRAGGEGFRVARSGIAGVCGWPICGDGGRHGWRSGEEGGRRRGRRRRYGAKEIGEEEARYRELIDRLQECIRVGRFRLDQPVHGHELRDLAVQHAHGPLNGRQGRPRPRGDRHRCGRRGQRRRRRHRVLPSSSASTAVAAACAA
ncbi:hypothetical protein BS78_K273200 [Paspalum vaginatum]|uniref:Uncharacterized protein n=1 Tax=Paspalum vaginatum TaxID=158149 RepID=A0A9W7XE10_9POAL|nr:hypothetical protein BS78_K273200 [Paspalum vaginatum]